MHKILSPSRRRGRAARVRLSACVISACVIAVGATLCGGFSVFAAETAAAPPVPAAARKNAPDLLDLSAARNPRAAQSMQLAAARAGDRLATAGEGGTVLLSDDGGVSWRQAAAVPVSVALTDIAFIDAKRGWAVGHSGALLRTLDGGETWTRQADGAQAAQWAADEAAELVKSGAPGADRAARAAASLLADGPDKPFLAVAFIDAKRGYAVGAYGLALETRDGGETWRSIMARLPNPAGKHLYRVVASPQGPVVVGEQGLLMRSADGGDSFEAVESPYEGTFFTALPLNDGGVLAAGLKGNVWRGDAGLEKWRRVPLPQPVTVTAALRLIDGTILLTDEVGRIMASGDDGRSFAPAAADNGPAETGAAATGVIQAPDGGVVASTARGPRRIDLKIQPLSKEAR